MPDSVQMRRSSVLRPTTSGGLNPAAGSSSIRIRGFATSARAISTKRCCANESSTGRLNSVSPMPRKRSVSITRCCASSSSGLRPLGRNSDVKTLSRIWSCIPISTFSSTVNCGKSCTDWNVRRMPMRARR